VLPASFPLPVFVVQHMPVLFTRLLAERLNGQSALTVAEAEHGMAVKAGHVYIAPGDYHLRVKAADGGQILTIDQGPPENSCRPAVDVLFRSAVDVYGGALVAVVMTGMGQDGLRGAEVIRAHGGQVVVQDEASSVVWGMPGAIAQAGLADAIVPLDRIVPDIVRRT
jgi:two-component system chemotaxis response regulator CheB